MKYTITFLCAAAVYNVRAASPSFNIEYTSEGQYGITSRKANFVNLLRTDFEQPVHKSGSLSLATIHIYKIKRYCVADDYLTFSNIEEDRTPVAIAILGYTRHFSHSDLFFGVRNMNEDYFASPLTSFFTNSSCGIYPTISTNYPIANYPVSSLCVHYKLSTEKWGVKGSIYNGAGYNGWTKNDNPFIINLKKDGVMGLTELNYNTDYGTIYCGTSVHNLMHIYDEALLPATETFESQEKNSAQSTQSIITKMNFAWWTYAEFDILRGERGNISCIAQYSRNTSSDNFCHNYYGVGGLCSYTDRHNNVHRLGVISAGAKLKDKECSQELFTEICYAFEKGCFTLKPVIHIINNSAGNQCVMMMRIIISI